MDTVDEGGQVCRRIVRHTKNLADLIGPAASAGVDLLLPTPNPGEMLYFSQPRLASPQSLFDQLAAP